MTLCISDTAARMLAANFMGADEEAVSPDEVEGVVKEMANILCGGLLERLNGDGRFTISSPTLIEPSLVGEMHGTMQTRRSFDLEIGTLAVGVSISEQSEAS
jgi:CheY-specific phosphatase CheX